MVGTIICVVNADREKGRRADVFWLHLGGYFVGAAAMGFIVGALGGFLRRRASVDLSGFTALAVVGATGLLYSLREMRLLRVPAPQTFRQVPARLRLQLPARQVALLYGLELGTGLTTHSTVTTFYVAVMWVFLVGDPALGALGMTAYGLGRALPIFLIGRRPTSQDDRSRMVDLLAGRKSLVHLVNGLALGFFGTCILVAGLITAR